MTLFRPGESPPQVATAAVVRGGSKKMSGRGPASSNDTSSMQSAPGPHLCWNRIASRLGDESDALEPWPGATRREQGPSDLIVSSSV